MKFRTFLLALIFGISLIGYTQNNTTKATYAEEKDILYRLQENITDYMKERCVLDIYYPTKGEAFSTIVWFHGGGLTFGNKYIPKELKEKGVAIVAVNYRLYPKIKAPIYIEDAAAAVAWTFKNIEKYLRMNNCSRSNIYFSNIVGLYADCCSRGDSDSEIM